MAEQVSTLVVTLTHGCHGCFRRIRKTICKLQDTEDIRTISSDEASRTVTISGTFDPLVLPSKLRRKVGRGVIGDIQLLAAEPRLTPQQHPPAVRVLPNPSAPPPCCCANYKCEDYGSCGCTCHTSAVVVNLPPAGSYRGELRLSRQCPKTSCDCEEALSCTIM